MKNTNSPASSNSPLGVGGSSSSSVKRIGGLNFASAKSGTYAVAYSGQDDQIMHSVLNCQGSWESYPFQVGGVRVVPHGADNNLPANIRNLLEKNNLGPGILARKTGLQYGKGPFLYRLKFENNEIVREWVQDAEVQAWLDTWDYKGFVRNALQEFNYMQGVYVKYYSGKAQRLKKQWIAKLECENTNECRLEWPENGTRLKDVSSIIVWDFENNTNRIPALRYPIYPVMNPYGMSMRYHNYQTFGRNFYSLPVFIGSIPWIRRANDIPEIIQYLTENMIAAAYQVHEPAKYWEEKEYMVREKYPEYDNNQIAAEVDKLRDELTKTIANVLSGKTNTGKFFESIDFVDDNGNPCNWKIEPIEMNVDKFIEAQSKISVLADSSTTSGFGLNPALSNIIIQGKGDAGSQILYAWKLFYAADVQIAEDIVFEAIHAAFKINFPTKNLSMGLYEPVAAKESDLSASARPAAKV